VKTSVRTKSILVLYESTAYEKMGVAGY